MTREEAIQFLTDTGISPEHIMELVEALSRSEKPNKQNKSEARRWKRRYLDLKQRIFKLEEQTKWIPVSARLPEEKVNPITHDYYEYQCTFHSGDIYDVRSYKFGKGHWWLGCGMMDEYVTAWMPLPLPYKASPTGAEKER